MQNCCGSTASASKAGRYPILDHRRSIKNSVSASLRDMSGACKDKVKDMKGYKMKMLGVCWGNIRENCKDTF